MSAALSFVAPEPLPQIGLRLEQHADIAAREALLDLAMGKHRKRKSSETLRRGRLPADGLALVAVDDAGSVIGTVRLWHVDAGGVPALLLGPLAVSKQIQGSGIGSMLMQHAVAEAARLGHGAILLVGDAPYYQRFGFSAEKTTDLSMPGPYEKHRLLALELRDQALAGAAGMICPTGQKAVAEEKRRRFG
ncbi:N-acetyltransferase [Aureimonas fodinaquatilis]|uniref:N-acetyltransferase n=1 Tax=Aureimonas fodinaquatilis TaxID=2565783 RepID=A0A5B0E2C7_9HYPH|nr:N-acetyltransferase [Aureimonas fodinaquatilis]KAA0972275.1 N-acetyltransferase [Aureimonas fodinaquatilis]